MIRGFELKQSYNFEPARLISYTLATIHWDTKKQRPSIEQWLPLPTDKKTSNQKDISDETHLSLLAEIEAYEKRMGNI